MVRRWIMQTPVGRLGFPNYAGLRRFCERHGIEIPRKKKRAWRTGTEVEHYDWALLERRHGQKIRSLLLKEETANIPVRAIANLFGITQDLAKRKLRRFVIKIGGRLFVPKENTIEAINYVRDELEDLYVHMATSSVSRDYEPNAESEES